MHVKSSLSNYNIGVMQLRFDLQKKIIMVFLQILCCESQPSHLPKLTYYILWIWRSEELSHMGSYNTHNFWCFKVPIWTPIWNDHIIIWKN